MLVCLVYLWFEEIFFFSIKVSAAGCLVGFVNRIKQKFQTDDLKCQWNNANIQTFLVIALAPNNPEGKVPHVPYFKEPKPKFEQPKFEV